MNGEFVRGNAGTLFVQHENFLAAAAALWPFFSFFFFFRFLNLPPYARHARVSAQILWPPCDRLRRRRAREMAPPPPSERILFANIPRRALRDERPNEQVQKRRGLTDPHPAVRPPALVRSPLSFVEFCSGGRLTACPTARQRPHRMNANTLLSTLWRASSPSRSASEDGESPLEILPDQTHTHARTGGLVLPKSSATPLLPALTNARPGAHCGAIIALLLHYRAHSIKFSPPRILHFETGSQNE